MSRIDCLNRRRFLGLTGLGAAGLAFVPRMRRVRADTPPRARRLLVLHLAGGIRSSAAFHASGETHYNPYGLIEGTGTAFALGRLLDDSPPGTPPLGDDEYTLGAAWSGAVLPRFREVAGQLSVIGTWSEARGDHLRARIEEPTGSADGADPGLLTRLVAGMSAGGDLDMPAFHLVPDALFGAAPPALARHAPVALQSWSSLPNESAADPFAVDRTAGGWLGSPEMGSRRDQRVVDARAGAGRLLADAHAIHRRAARKVGGRLGQRDMQVADAAAADAALGEVNLAAGPVPLTNAMLFELMTRAMGPGAGQESGEEGSRFDSAMNAAVAVRLLQLGSPAVALEIGNFDFHSGERSEGPALYSFLGRLWASLGWLLARIPAPEGGTLLDSTLVVTTSDFGRDPAGPSGWNAGEGSDHGADAGCFYLAHAVMGAGVRGGQLIGEVSTRDYDARREPLQIAPIRLLATLLGALGVDPADPTFGFPAAGAPIDELWP
jgi:uncharacterized protein (DUF1501 family)